jgi:hypothetical protein
MVSWFYQSRRNSQFIFNTSRNNNGITLSATAEDDDDDSTVQTSNSNPTKQGWMFNNIKLLLTNKHNTSNSEMGGDSKIFNGAKQQVTEFQVQSVTTFRSNFPISRSNAHQKHNHSATAWVLFKEQTRQTLKDIRAHPTITQVLHCRQCRMIHHQWPLHVTDVMLIKFLVGETPTYKLPSTFCNIL